MAAENQKGAEFLISDFAWHGNVVFKAMILSQMALCPGTQRSCKHCTRMSWL